MKYEVNSDTKKCQQVLVEMMKEIHDLLEQNNIEYFLIGGSALGARRHQGFIPWDDDIDLGMDYYNYNKFLNLAKTNLPKKYSLLHYSVNKNSPQLYAKIVLNDSVFLEYSTAKLKIPHGFFIDVFPFYNVPDEEDEFRTMYNEYNKISELYVHKKIGRSNYFKGGPYLVLIKKIVLLMKKQVLSIVPDKYIIKKYEDLINKYDNCKSKKICACIGKSFLIRENMYPLQKIKFEDFEFYVCNNLDIFLKDTFGNNYMQLPPVENRLTHKPLKIEYPTDFINKKEKQ